MHRKDRVAEEIKKIVSVLIQTELQDPRLPITTTVTDVDVSRDLAYATIYVSTAGDEDDKKDLLDVMDSANGFLRHRVAEHLDLRKAPELRFKLDESIEKGIEMNKIIDQVMQHDAEFRKTHPAKDDNNA